MYVCVCVCVSGNDCVWRSIDRMDDRVLCIRDGDICGGIVGILYSLYHEEDLSKGQMEDPDGHQIFHRTTQIYHRL